MAMDLRQYFGFACNQMLMAERDILKMNNMMAEEVQNPRLKEMLQRHTQPTEQQIRNLEQVVERMGGVQQGQQGGMMERVGEAIGMGGGGGENPITQGMMRAHQQFKGMNPPQQLLDIHDVIEGNKVEHFEIAGYTGLIALARQLGENEIVQMLQQNLGGEEEMRTRIERDLPSLLSELGGQGRMAA